MKSIFKKISLTKNWPGGRRIARDGTKWTKTITNFKRPYIVIDPPSKGGVADPNV